MRTTTEFFDGYIVKIRRSIVDENLYFIKVYKKTSKKHWYNRKKLPFLAFDTSDKLFVETLKEFIWRKISTKNYYIGEQKQLEKEIKQL